MPSPTEATIREAYAAFGRGDVDGYLRPCTEDFEFHVPGSGGIGGIYVGKDGLYDLARKAMQITGGTFHEEVKRTCSPTSNTPLCWRVTASPGTGRHGTTGPHMFMKSVTESLPDASNNLGILAASTRLGDPLNPRLLPDLVGIRSRFIVILAALVMGTGGWSAAMRSSQSGGDGIDVCALLPREEASKILGYTVRARPAQRSDGATECRYAAAQPVPGLHGDGGHRHTKAKWDTFMKELRESGASLEPVAGVGAGAFLLGRPSALCAGRELPNRGLDESLAG